MSQYKVIQDIEAEDKLLGPLSLRQFIYAIIVLVCIYVGFVLAQVNVFLAAPMLPFIIFFGLLAAPVGKDQPSEVWLLAKIRFFLKPRKRIWNQSGISELVTITVPKKEEKILTKGYSQAEVKSRLRSLADTIDSRGWAVKNIDVSTYMQRSHLVSADSDRLIDPSLFPQDVPNYDTGAEVDMFEQDNPINQHFGTLISSSEQAHRQQIIQQMQGGQTATPQNPPANYWFLNQPSTDGAAPGYGVFDGTQTVQPQIGPVDQPNPVSSTRPVTTEEQALLDKIHKDQEAKQPLHSHMHTIDPLDVQQKKTKKQHKKKEQSAEPTPPVTPSRDPAILELANNDDLDVATLARQANKPHKQDPPDEVVISLH